ncbi:MAG TPA: hypothetical protein PKE21_17355, partial [Flavobacteriales bacterium]|nr:hypothetical protein [Flavobacteriales bacterium]HMR29248.1 hypothetical protein [Flavobacteriales bacterium]
MRTISPLLLSTCLCLAGMTPPSCSGQDMLPELNMWRPNSHVLCIAVDSANNVAYIGGLFTSLTDPDPPFTTVARNYAAAIDLTTGEPLSWNPDPDYHVHSITHTASSVYLGGGFYNVGGLNRPGLAAVDKVSGIAQSWDPGLQPNVMTMAIAAGKLFVGGTFWQVAGVSRHYAAAFDLSTGALTTWNPAPSDYVLALQPLGNTMYMGGYFSTIAGGLPSPYLAGVDLNSGTTPSYVEPPNAPVWALATTGGRLYLGGDFTEVGGTPRSYAAALAAGSLTGWQPEPDGYVNALAVIGGQVAMGGGFLWAGGQSYNSYLVVVDAVTGTATSWNPRVLYDVSVLAASGGRLLAGGVFHTSMQFETRNFVTFTPAPTLVRVQPKVFLQGCYVSAQQNMHDSLRRASLVPQTEPYTALGYTYTAGGAPGTFTSNVMAHASNGSVVDWVVVELRDALNPALIAASKRGVLLRNGSVVDVNRLSPLWIPVPPGSYHVAVRHRNHLGVMTATPVPLTATSTTIDLTAAGSTAYGSNALAVIGTRKALWAGDANGNGQVKYAGATNDRDAILTAIGGGTPTNT